MIAYKVVEKRTRWCSNWTLFKNGTMGQYTKDTEKELRKRFKNFNKWFPRYKKGTIVEAVSGSVGILTFLDRTDAEKFQKDNPALRKNGMIIKVEGIGNPKKVNRLCSGCGSSPQYISRLKKYFEMRAPTGTTAFKAVSRYLNKPSLLGSAVLD